jgi:hypothetical protein
MLPIADGKSSHPAVVIGLPRAAGQILHTPCRPIEINLVNLSTWCVVDVELIVGRGGEGYNPAKLGVGGSANACGQIHVDPLRRFYHVSVLVNVRIVSYAVHFKLTNARKLVLAQLEPFAKLVRLVNRQEFRPRLEATPLLTPRRRARQLERSPHCLRLRRLRRTEQRCPILNEGRTARPDLKTCPQSTNI